MDTLQKLQEIDEVAFESLSTIYLQKTYPKLFGLIHTGINSEGKSIKCPVDAVIYISGDPAFAITAAYTTTERSGLNRKWLGGSKGKTYEKGDIQKAHDELEAWKAKFQGTHNVQRILYLITNRPLESDTDLYINAIAKGQSLDIEIVVVEATQLVRFLDFDPEGQYLRQEFLGIDAFRLSESLLKKIGRQSIEQHKNTFAFDSDKQIQREAHSNLEDIINREQSALIGIRGASGTGKSTLARQFGEHFNNSGNGICIWAPAEDLVANVSIKISGS